MATGTIKKCDVCGVIHNSLQDNNRHWSNTIEYVRLSLKDHPGIQSIPFEGDICTSCGLEMCEVINDFLKSKCPTKDENEIR